MARWSLFRRGRSKAWTEIRNNPRNLSYRTVDHSRHQVTVLNNKLTKPAHFFGKLGQTPQWSLGQNVSGHQILSHSGNV